jgi:hypothetical protein
MLDKPVLTAGPCARTEHNEAERKAMGKLTKGDKSLLSGGFLNSTWPEWCQEHHIIL